MVGQYDDAKCTLATCNLHDDAKHGFDHHDVVNRIKIFHAIPTSKFVIYRNTADTSVCDVVSKLTKAMIAQQVVNAAANIVELFVQTLVVKNYIS